MKNFILTIILGVFTLPYVAVSQNSPIAKQGFGLYIMPLSLVSPPNRLRLGAEYFNGNKLGYSLDFGIITPRMRSSKYHANTSAGINGHDLVSFEIRPEFKYYFSQKENRHLYVALELVYIKTTDLRKGGFYYPLNSRDDSGFRYNEANWTEVKTGADLKLGYKLMDTSKPFFIEGYVGFGGKKLTRFYSNVINPIEASIEPTEEWGSSSATSQKEKDAYVPLFTLGFKFGYVFWGK